MAGPIRIAVLANGAQAKKEIDSVSSRADRMKRGLNAAGKVAAVGFAAVGVAAAKMAQAAAEDEAAASKLAHTLKVAAKASDAQVAATEKYIEAAGRSLGVSDDQLRPALGRLAAASGSVAKAQQQANLAMDVAQGSGKSLEAVSTALAKAQTTGNVKALAKFGIATTDARGKTISLATATQRLADKYKGAAAKSATTVAGKQKILAVQFDELKESIGAKLLPVMRRMVAFGLSIVAWTQKHSTAAKILAGIVAGLGVAILTAVGFMKAYNLATGVHNALLAIKAANTKRAAAGQAALNATMLANPIVLVVAAIAALVAGFVLAYKKSETFRNIINKVGEVGKTALGWIVERAKDVYEKFSPILTVIGKIRDFMRDKFGKAFTAARDAVVAAGRLMLKPFTALWTTIQRILNALRSVPLLGSLLGSGAPEVNMGAETADKDRSSSRAAQVIINVTAPPLTNPVEVGRVAAEALDAYYSTGGRVYA